MARHQPSTPIPPSARWVAWRKEQGGRWTKLAITDSEALAWQAIYSAMDNSEPGHYSSMVLREGVKP